MDGASPVRIRLLGRFGMEAGGRTVVDGTGPYGPARALIKALVVAPDRMLHREQVLHLMWPRLSPAAANANLRQCMYNLRSACAASGAAMPVEVHGNLLTFASGVAFDIDEFRRLAELALERRTDMAAFEQALAVYRGALLSDDPYDDALSQLRETLAGLRLRLLIGLAHLKMAHGQDAAALARAQDVLASDETHEEAHRILMRLFARAGQRDRAMRQYARCVDVLRRELGVEPAAETVALHREIVEGRSRTPAAVPAGTFVGREAELRVLRTMFEDADGGRGAVASIGGDPGIGKTRLAEEVAQYARLRGARVAWARCPEGDAAPPFWPWIQAIRQLSEHGGAPADLTQLSGMVPVMAGAAGVGADRQAEEARFELFQAVVGFLRGQASASTVVIVLDDLHGARSPALRLLESLSREVRDVRLLVVACHRAGAAAEALTQTFAELTREPRNRRLTLAGLERDDVRRLVDATTPTAATPELVDALYVATEGNPLFVGEMLRLVGDDVERALPLRVPESVRDVIRARVAALTPPCRLVLGVSSVVGREFGVELLHRIGDVASLGLGPLLATAERQRIIEPMEGGGRYRFAHALIRQTIYEDQPAATRASRHLQIGEALEAVPGRGVGTLPELAHHFARATEVLGPASAAKAEYYAAEAARVAGETLAYEEAARLYEEALDMHDRRSDAADRERCALLMDLADMRDRAGDGDGAKEAFREAAAVATRTGDRLALTRAALGYGTRLAYGEGGFVDSEQVAMIEAAVDAWGDEDHPLHARLLSRLSIAIYFSSQDERRRELAARSVEMARRVGDVGALAYALHTQHRVWWHPAWLGRRRGIAGEMLSSAIDAGDVELTAQAHLRRVADFMELGDAGGATEELDAAAELANRTKQPLYLWWMRVLTAARLAIEGGFDAADAALLEGQKLVAGRSSPYPQQTMGVHLTVQEVIARLRGAMAPVLPVLSAATQAYPAVRAFRSGIAFALAETGDLHGARREFEQLAGGDFSGLPADANWFAAIARLGETCVALGDVSRAAILYDMLSPYGSLHVNIGEAAYWGSCWYYLGLLATTLRRWDEAVRHFDDALAAHERMRAHPWNALTRFAYARMLLTRGAASDQERALTLLAQARITAIDLGMSSLVARIDMLDGEGG